MTGQDFRNLLRFYLVCVESEDRRSVTRKLSALHRSLISPWSEKEPFFHPEAQEALLHAFIAADRALLLDAAGAKVGTGSKDSGSERPFYGYPMFLDAQGFLSPLFIVPVQIAHRGGGWFAMRAADANTGIQLNQYLFPYRHAQPEEWRTIQRELEGEYGSFASRLAAAFRALGLPRLRLAADRLDPFPDTDSPRERWINRPMLFWSARNAHFRHLARELEALGRYSRLADAVGGTAAGVLAGMTPVGRLTQTARFPDCRARGLREPPLVEILPLNDAQEQAARAGLRAPFTVVTGPPGTGKSQIIVDLLASCAKAGRPVLFASKNNRAVDVVRNRFRAILGEEQDWVLRLGNRMVMEESHRDMSGRLAALVPAGAPRAPARWLIDRVGRQINDLRERLRELELARAEYSRLDRLRRAAANLVDPAWIARSSVEQSSVEQWPIDQSPVEPSSIAPSSIDWRWTARAGTGRSQQERARLRKLERLTETASALARTGPSTLTARLARTVCPALAHRIVRARLRALARGLPAGIRADLASALEATAPRVVHGSRRLLARAPSNARTNRNLFAPVAEASRKLLTLLRWRAAEEVCARVRSLAIGAEPREILAGRLRQSQQRQGQLLADELRAAWTGRLADRTTEVRHALDRYHDLAWRVMRTHGHRFLELLGQFAREVRCVSRDLPVWIVTHLSVRNALPLEPGLFDLVILDEASQSDIASALPLLFRARRALIIGDPGQLGHISTLSAAEETRLASACGADALLAAWSHTRISLYACAERVAVERGGGPIFLAEHYRSHPDIVRFSNEAFYQGRLITRTEPDRLCERLDGEPVGLFWHDVRGCVSSSEQSAVNELEISAIVDLLDRWSSTGFLLRDAVDFGIVTPFRLQMERLDEAVKSRPWRDAVKDRLAVGTAHRFQGDERDVMIFSPVVASGMRPRLVRWVADTDQLLNVALTRARAALHVVGDLGACVKSGGFLGRFAASVTAVDRTGSSPDAAAASS